MQETSVRYKFLLLIFMTGSLITEAAGATDFHIIYCFDFGSDFQKVATGWTPVSRVYRSSRYLWIGELSENERMGDDADPLLSDFVSGKSGEFWVGLDNGEYEVSPIMANPTKQGQGPVTIFVQDQVAREGIRLGAGEVWRTVFHANVRDKKLRIRLEATDNNKFYINGLVISGPEGKAPRPIFSDAPPDFLPQTEQVMRDGKAATPETLRQLCDWLLSHRLPNGFLGDYEASKASSPKYWWYTSSYPIRTLLAGYEIFGEKKYLDASVQILDQFVQEQLPNGAWQQTYRSQPTRELSPAQIEEIVQHNWMNMADIGSMVTALAISCHYVPEPKKSTYLMSLRRYCDEWAPRWQLPSGGFTNGLENGIPQTKIYSVATATEAAAFAAAYAVTKDAKYLKRAQSAAQFLLNNWRPDGRPVAFPHHSTNEGKPYDQPISQFGDIFYYHDGILLVYHHSKDPVFRQKVESVYRWHVKGERGLIAGLGSYPWWGLQDNWDNSKTAGMLLVLLAYQDMDEDPAVDRAVVMAERFLSTPQFSRLIGVMVEDPQLPWGGHSLQSWAGSSIAATGFAGLSITEIIKPGIIYLSPKRIQH